MIDFRNIVHRRAARASRRTSTHPSRLQNSTNDYREFAWTFTSVRARFSVYSFLVSSPFRFSASIVPAPMHTDISSRGRARRLRNLPRKITRGTHLGRSRFENAGARLFIKNSRLSRFPTDGKNAAKTTTTFLARQTVNQCDSVCPVRGTERCTTLEGWTRVLGVLG